MSLSTFTEKDEKKRRDFDTPAEKADNSEHGADSRSISTSLEMVQRNEAEKDEAASREKLSRTENSSEKNSIASEKITEPSRGAEDLAGDGERQKSLTKQLPDEQEDLLREQAPPPPETSQQPSCRLSPVSATFTGEQRDKSAGTLAGFGAALSGTEEMNTDKVPEGQIQPVFGDSFGRASRRELPLRKTLNRRLFSKPRSFIKFSGALEGLGEGLCDGWKKLRKQVILLSTIFGLLSVLLMVVAVTSSSWRTHKFLYEDSNGHNTVTVHAGLSAVQRIHKLTMHNDTATLYLVDAARSFNDLIDSPLCIEKAEKVREEYESWITWVDKESPQHEETQRIPSEPLVSHTSRRLSETDDGFGVSNDSAKVASVAQDGGEQTGEEHEDEVSSGWPPESATDEDLAESDIDEPTAADAESDKRKDGQISSQKMQALAPFQLVFGRDPAAAGNMTPAASMLRRALLGPVIFELNCRHLPKLKLAGDTIWSLMLPALVLSAVALVAALLSSNWVRSLFGSSAYPTSALQYSSAALWLLVVILTLAGLSSWGAISDVAACVSDTGGASVCPLGLSSTLALGALILQLLAACCIVYIARKGKAPASRRLRDVITETAATHLRQDNDGTPRSYHNFKRQEEEYFDRTHAEGVKDVTIAVDENGRPPSGQDTPPTAAGQERGSHQLTTTESQSEAGAAGTRRAACNSLLRSLLRRLTYVGGVILAKVLPGCFVVIAPQPLKQVAPQVGAIIAAAVTQTVTEIVEDMCDADSMPSKKDIESSREPLNQKPSDFVASCNDDRV